MPEFDVCNVQDVQPGQVKAFSVEGVWIALFNCHGKLHAIEDRCSHDDGPLADGDWNQDSCIVVCPRHGAEFDIASGEALTLPATEAVEIFPVAVVDGVVRVTVNLEQ